ncbi:alpha/beta hydrolase-fold protein [Streptomyces sp. P9(2023)]|uniref:alpha/beta hydrolase n=1 Tax=Streptomyces sp. P9(2023) TaxID=3064394 RepID=UPI0028F417BA|nr:alpha/beta hydrolase-fold protein [Streptomyces sp. P9(2023)]MDT9690560.1 alpha/beta hydrolase-fold protein [Streptomyces sp. P9(2023)]
MTRLPRVPRILATVLALGATAALVSGCSGEGAPVTFDTPGSGTTTLRAKGPANVPETVLPTGPKASFTTANTLEDGTKIGVTTLAGAKSGFTGKVWVWAPKQYFDPKYAESGFPVLVALPGGNGYPMNYWMGTDLKLQSSISTWSQEGKSLPFIVVMPVLNPDDKFYYDGSDIPGQPKMGTWLTEDVPDFVRANFRTFASRDGWAFMGSSSGAFAGLKAVLQRPEKFKAVIASGPDTVPDSPLWAGHEAERQANNPEKLAKALGAKPDTGKNRVYLAFQIGTKESGMGRLKAFMRDYGKGPVKTRLQVIQGGGHNAKSYVQGMEDGSIAWISRQMQGPVPSS